MIVAKSGSTCSGRIVGSYASFPHSPRPLQLRHCHSGLGGFLGVENRMAISLKVKGAEQRLGRPFQEYIRVPAQTGIPERIDTTSSIHWGVLGYNVRYRPDLR